MGASSARLNRVYRRHYASAEARPASSPGEDEGAREAHRQAGRRLIETLLAFLDQDAADAIGRRDLEAEANRIVDEQAARLAASGTGLTEAVAGFVTSRQPFLAEIAGLGRRRSLDAAPLAALYADASGLLDRLLLRFVAAHQRAGG